MLYLLAYDIANPSRLQRVARRLERYAQRVQKSVFVFRGDHTGVVKLLDDLVPIINAQEDLVQAWKLAGGESIAGLVRGQLPIQETASAVCAAGQHRLILKTSTNPNDSWRPNDRAFILGASFSRHTHVPSHVDASEDRTNDGNRDAERAGCHLGQLVLIRGTAKERGGISCPRQ